MCAVGVGQVAGDVNLMRLHLSDKLANDVDVLLGHGELLDGTALIERQVEEVNVVERNVVVCAGCASLTAANQTLDGQDVACVGIAVLLLLEELLDLLVFVLDDLVLVAIEDLVEAVDEVHEACNLLVAHSDVTAGLVGNVHVVTLLHQSTDGATH